MYLNIGIAASSDSSAKFNFNKSCIWIYRGGLKMNELQNLTLTRVVFECMGYIYKKKQLLYLTLTRVVFE